ncbi:MAG: hypothetical protein PVH88_13505 [Ignavibacteria bacterium]|jgi:hypothetical protein
MQTFNAKNYFRKLDLIFLSLIFSYLFFFFTALFLKDNICINIFPGDEDTSKITALIITSSAVVISKFIFNIIPIKTNSSIKTKLKQHFILTIIRFLLLDLSMLINLFLYLANKDNLFLLIYGIIFLLNFAYRLTFNLLQKEIKIDVEKIELLTKELNKPG